MSDENVMVSFQFDQESKARLAALAAMSERSMSAMVRWLIAQEYARRFSAPNAGVSVGEAMAAGEASSVSL